MGFAQKNALISKEIPTSVNVEVHRRGQDIQIGTLLKALVDLELLGTLDELGKPGLRVPNQNGNGDGHTTLTGS